MDSGGRASFAERLAALRDQAGLSLAAVAATAHVARGYVHHLEHGRRWPTQGVAQALERSRCGGSPAGRLGGG
jgi:transcriptional regulator with XRE-family HTH domain